MVVALLVAALGLLLIVRASRTPIEPPATETLDQGLAYLIKHVTREPTFDSPAPPRARWPKGTTRTNADEVAVATRLRALAESTGFEEDAPTTVRGQALVRSTSSARSATSSIA